MSPLPRIASKAREIREHDDRIRHLAHVRGGSTSRAGTVWSSSSRGAIFVHDAMTFDRVAQIQHGGDELSASVSKSIVSVILPVMDGRRMWTGSSKGSICVWDTATHSMIYQFLAHKTEVCCMCDGVDPSTRREKVFVGSADRTVSVWDAETHELLQTLSGHSNWVRCCLVVGPSLESPTLWTGSDDTTIRVWDIVSGTCKHALTGHSGGILCAVLVPNPAGGGAQPQGNVSGRMLFDRLRYGQEDAPAALVWTGACDRSIRCWDVSTTQLVMELTGHMGWVTDLVVGSARRDVVISGSSDRTLRIWAAQTGQCLGSLEAHAGWVTALLALPSGDIWSGGSDQVIRVWNLRLPPTALNADAGTSVPERADQRQAQAALTGSFMGMAPAQVPYSPAPRFVGGPAVAAVASTPGREDSGSPADRAPQRKRIYWDFETQRFIDPDHPRTPVLPPEEQPQPTPRRTPQTFWDVKLQRFVTTRTPPTPVVRDEQFPVERVSTVSSEPKQPPLQSIVSGVYDSPIPPTHSHLSDQGAESEVPQSAASASYGYDEALRDALKDAAINGNGELAGPLGEEQTALSRGDSQAEEQHRTQLEQSLRRQLNEEKERAYRAEEGAKKVATQVEKSKGKELQSLRQELLEERRMTQTTTTEVEQLRQKLGSVTKELEQLRDSLVDANSKRDEVESARSEAAKLQLRLEAALHELDEQLKQNAAERATVSRLRRDLSENERKMTKSVQEARDWQQREGEAERSVASLQGALASLRSDLEEAEEKTKYESRQRESMQDKLGRLESQVHSLQHQLEDEITNRNEAQSRILSLERELDDARQRLQRSTQAHDDLVAAMQAKSSLQTQRELESVRDQLTREQRTANEVSGVTARLQRELQKAKQVLTAGPAGENVDIPPQSRWPDDFDTTFNEVLTPSRGIGIGVPLTDVPEQYVSQPADTAEALARRFDVELADMRRRLSSQANALRSLEGSRRVMEDEFKAAWSKLDTTPGRTPGRFLSPAVISGLPSGGSKVSQTDSVTAMERSRRVLAAQLDESKRVTATLLGSPAVPRIRAVQSVPAMPNRGGIVKGSAPITTTSIRPDVDAESKS